MKFRPQNYSPRYRLRLARRNQHVGELNWYAYIPRAVHGVGTIQEHLHYLACHAPKNINVRWYPAWLRLVKHYKNL